MTQSEFSEFCGVSVVSISRYENGGSISLRNAESIANACHVSLDYIFKTQQDFPVDKQEKYNSMLTSDEEAIISDYRKLSPRGRFRLRETLDEMLQIYPE